MPRKVWLIAGLALLLFVCPGTAVFAQDGGGGSGDKLVLGQDFVLRAGEMLSGNLAVLGGNVTLERGSTLGGDLAVAGGNLAVAGTVKGSVVVLGGSIRLDGSAVVEGDLAVFGGKLQRSPGAVVRGEIIGGAAPAWQLNPAPPQLPTPPRLVFPLARRMSGGLDSIISWELGAAAGGLLMALLAVLALLVAPRAMGRIARVAGGQPALSFGAGLLTFAVAALAGALLLVACCTGLLIWLALAAGLIVGWIAVGWWFGGRLLAALKVRAGSALVEAAIGVFLITFASRLPLCIGFLFSAVVGAIGLGAVVLTRFGTQPVDGQFRPAGTLEAGSEPADRLPAGPDAGLSVQAPVPPPPRAGPAGDPPQPPDDPGMAGASDAG